MICLKYFALEFSAEATSDEFGLNYKTVKMLFNLFRMKIGDYDFSYERLKNELMNTDRQGHISQLERFWRFAAERFYSYKGTEQKYFIIFLKEIEFSFNHQNEDIFDAIVAKLS
ncbi:MAG: hypothetical protein Q8933_18225 [Bacteroidota bacterium]|nr:hypothetical protein [Bacteroidota bacterium]MDP4197141.1 hypothetical protein [Bacteroidota bacterium]